MTDDAYQQLMKHAHRLAMDGHGELAQFLRDAMTDAERYRWLRGIDSYAEWTRFGHYAADALDAAIDAARSVGGK